MLKTGSRLLTAVLAAFTLAASVPSAEAASISTKTLQKDASAAAEWLAKNGKDHEWKPVARFAGLGTWQSTTWTTSQLAKLKTTTDYAKLILAMLASGQDPHRFHGKDYVAALARAQITSGSDKGKIADYPNRTGSDIYTSQMWGIIALEDAGGAHYDRAAAAKWLIAHQNKDGGFGSSRQYSSSDPDDTASAIVALSLLGYGKDSAPVTKALAYLKTAQNADGGFGTFGTSNSDSTAFVIDALTALGLNPDSWTKSHGVPSSALVSFFDSKSGGFRWDNSNSQWSGVNEMSTKDGLFGLGALIWHKSVYQRLHWRTLSSLNPYWTNIKKHGGMWYNHHWLTWKQVQPMAVAGSYVSQLTPKWQAVVKVHGMYVQSGKKKVWHPWDATLALQALNESFGQNTVHLNGLE
jgi:hypothetical protein